MEKRKRWIAEFLVFVVVLSGIRFWQQRDVPEGPAPVLRGVLLDGKVFGKPSGPVLVHFWGTWCPICRTEENSIQKLSREHSVVTVALKSGSAAEVTKYMKDRSLDFPVLNDPEGEISSQWGVAAVPASFFLDREGRIRFVEFGYTTSVGLRIRLWLAGFLS